MAKFAKKVASTKNIKSRDAHRLKKDRIKNQKQKKKLQAQGFLKKRNPKHLSLPNLQKHKQRIVNTLKAKKQNPQMSRTINKLQTEDKPTIQNYLDIKQQQQYQDQSDSNEYQQLNKKITEGRKFYKDIKKVLQSCDILVQVLDARDPLASRCKTIQQKILSLPGEKKIILLLNKIDLIPVQNAQVWQNYLRRQYPTVLFKANLQNQNANLSSNVLFKKSLSQNHEIAEQMIHSSKSVGPDHLLQLIKQLSKVQGTNRAVTVGLIGYPNVGKSSVINSLKRAKACQVSAIAGSTKNLQQVKLDKQVKLLDCPGVIFEHQNKNNLILRNTLKLDGDLQDIVSLIIQKVEKTELMELYKLQTFTSCQDFLARIAKNSGRLIKGGIPDFKQAAKLVVEDWNRGRIKYFSIPPRPTGSMQVQA